MHKGHYKLDSSSTKYPLGVHKLNTIISKYLVFLSNPLAGTNNTFYY